MRAFTFLYAGDENSGSFVRVLKSSGFFPSSLILINCSTHLLKESTIKELTAPPRQQGGRSLYVKGHVGRAPSPVQARPAARRVVVYPRDFVCVVQLPCSACCTYDDGDRRGRLSYGANHIQPHFGQALARDSVHF